MRRVLTTTDVAPDGSVFHETRWHLENYGQSAITATFSPGADLLRVRVDGVEVETVRTEKNVISIPLPIQAARPVIDMEFSGPRCQFRAWSRLTLDAPKPDVPTLDRYWQVKLPSRYRAWNIGGQPRPFHPNGLQRLFGWLAKSSPDGAAENTIMLPLVNERSGIRIYDTKVSTLLGWLAFLAAILATARLPVFRWETAVFLTGTVCLVLIFAPAPILSLLRGLAGGIAWGMIVRTVSTWQPVAKSLAPAKELLATSRLILIAAYLVANHCAPRQLSAQVPDHTTPPIYRVLFPIDENGQPASKYVQVPRAMYEQLVTRAEANKPATDKWLIRSARYRCSLTSELAEPEWLKIDATFQLHVFRPGSMVALTMPHSADHQLAEFLLDGQQVDWQPGRHEGEIRFRVEEAGEHRWQFQQTLKIDPGQSRNRVEMAIIQVPDSRLELSVGDDVQGTISTPNFQIAFDGEAQRQSIALGPSLQVGVEWQNGSHPPIANRAPLRRLSWLRVAPGLLVCECRYRPSRPGVPLSDITLRIPPNIRMLTPDPSDVPSAVKQREDNRLQLSAPANRNEIRLRFAVVDSSGIGEIRLPQVDMDGDRITNDLWAVSVDPSLSYERSMNDASAPITRSEFMEAWGTAEEPPAFSFSRSAVQETSFKTHIRRSSSLAQTRLDLACDRGESSLTFHADVSPIEGLLFQQRIQIPARVTVDSVILEQDGQPRLARWQQDTSGIVHVLPASHLDGVHHITLQGRYETQYGTHPLPSIQMLDSTSTFNEVSISRRSSVNVDVVNPVGFSREALPTADFTNESMPVARLTSSDATAQASLRVEPNEPEIRGRMRLALRYEEDGWWADVDYRVRFEGGIPDRFVFQIPGDWQGDQLTIQPARATKIVDLANGQRRLIVSHQPETDRENFHLRMSHPLASKPNVSVPIVLPIGQPFLLRLLTLPTRVGDKSVKWDMRGLAQAQLPDEFADPPAGDATCTFRMVDEDSGARLDRLQAPASPPRVFLRHVEASLARRACHLVTTFDLAPQGSASVTIRIAEPLQLISADIDGLTTPAVKLDSHRYRIDLVSGRLAQRLRLYTKTTSALRDLRTTRVPEVEGAEIVASTWTVRSLRRAISPGTASILSCTAAEIDRARLDATLLTAETNAEAISDGTDAEIRAWLQRLFERAMESSTSDAEAEKNRLADQLTRLARRLGLKDFAPRRQPHFLAEARSPLRTANFCTPLNPPTLPVAFVSNNLNELAGRLWATLAVAMVTIFGYLLIAAPSLRGWALEWLHAAVIVIGLAWILLLKLPWFGLLLVSLGIWFSLVPGSWDAPVQPAFAGSGDATVIRQRSS